MPHEFADPSDSAAFYNPEMCEPYGQLGSIDDDRPLAEDVPPLVTTSTMSAFDAYHDTAMRFARESGAYQARCELLIEALRAVLPPPDPRGLGGESLAVWKARGTLEICEKPI